MTDDLQAELDGLSVTEPRAYVRAVGRMAAELRAEAAQLRADAELLESETALSVEEELSEARDDVAAAAQRCVEASAEVERAADRFRADLPADLLDALAAVDELSRELAYRRACAQLVACNGEVADALQARDWMSLHDAFGRLADLRDGLTVTGSRCVHLVSAVDDSTAAWSERLTAELSSALGKAMDALGWPFESARDLSSASSDQTEFLDVFKALAGVVCAADDDAPHSDLLVRSLLEPIRKRFLFHFYGDRKTNAAEHPEWFCTQALQWVNCHAEFIGVKLQPLVVVGGGGGGGATNLRAEFVRGVVELVGERVKVLLLEIAEQPSLFAHLIDELVSFEAELSAEEGYRHLEAGALDVLAEEPYVSEWIELERHCNADKAEQILLCANAWASRYEKAADLDEFKVPECVDDFLLLLQLITERYRLLRSTVTRSRFLQLQIDLLDDFRQRLVQIYRALTSPWREPYVELMNGLDYVSHVLAEWGDMPFFIMLQNYAARTALRVDGGGGGGVVVGGSFDDAIDLYGHLWTQMAAQLVREALVVELRRAIEPYRRERWYALGGARDARPAPTGLSASVCAPLLVLRDRLGVLQTRLSRAAFAKTLGRVNEAVAALLDDGLVAQTAFNAHGAGQLLFDLSNGLLPLLASYDTSDAPTREEPRHAQMAVLLEKVRVLALPVPTAVLLSETLSNTPDSLLGDLAQDFGVYTLTRDQCLALLKQRVDIGAAG